jgi:hypothetical protein
MAFTGTYAVALPNLKLRQIKFALMPIFAMPTPA